MYVFFEVVDLDICNFFPYVWQVEVPGLDNYLPTVGFILVAKYRPYQGVVRDTPGQVSDIREFVSLIGMCKDVAQSGDASVCPRMEGILSLV